MGSDLTNRISVQTFDISQTNAAGLPGSKDIFLATSNSVEFPGGVPVSGNGSGLTNLNATNLVGTIPSARLSIPFASLKATALMGLTNNTQVISFGSVASNSTVLIPSTVLNSISNTVAGDFIVTLNPHWSSAAAGWGAILKTNGVLCGVTNMWGFQNIGSAPYPGGGSQSWHVRLPANVNCTLETRVQTATVSIWAEFRLEWIGP